jgi:TRAP-type C4-dicarboxylate transport system permease small subunit
MTGENMPGTRTALLVRLLSYLAAALLFAMMALVVVDVVGRYITGRPIRGAFEIVGFLLGVMVFAGIAVVSQRNDHITVSLFDYLFQGRLRWVQQAFVLVFSAVVVGFVCVRLFAAAERMRQRQLLALSFDIQVAPVVYVMSALAGIACLLLVGLLIRHLRTPMTAPEDSPVPPDE